MSEEKKHCNTREWEEIRLYTIERINESIQKDKVKKEKNDRAK